MRTLILAALLVGCSSPEAVGTQKQKVLEDYPLTYKAALAAIEAHDGLGCLRMDSYDPCPTCAPMYRLDPVADGASVGPCGRSTFVAGSLVRVRNEKTYTWTCASSPLGGTWNGEETGALVCRD